ncbi:hypothetical protein HAX54_043639 [Datura stramonium]|uniref:Uncharacterized protein n=1 Tax=Datura stramonium TaxID=4076 RepID=A0ABS8SNR2_DATST|nr:hypothetical protein [Datura stramonium]
MTGGKCEFSDIARDMQPRIWWGTMRTTMQSPRVGINLAGRMRSTSNKMRVNGLNDKAKYDEGGNNVTQRRQSDDKTLSDQGRKYKERSTIWELVCHCARNKSGRAGMGIHFDSRRELPKVGNRYTWNDRQGVDRVFSKIDWVFVNAERLLRCRTSSNFMVKALGDHCPPK